MNIDIVWQQFHGPLKGFIARRISNHSAVDDIVQDVFMKIILNMNELRDEQKIHAWIYKITRNAIIDYYRKQKPTEELPLQLHAIEDTEQDMSEELSSCIRPMIEQLPDKYREAMTLTELNGMSQKDLSVQLGISFSGAKSRVQRGRGKLKELLSACCHIEADHYGNIIDYHKVVAAEQGCDSESCGCK